MPGATGHDQEDQQKKNRRDQRVAIRAAHDARWLSVTIDDDGPGVPRDLRARIFEPGFSTKQSGWGIGLALARRIVEENHGGSLRLAAADRGAAFEIILP